MPDGNVFGNISLAHHLTIAFFEWIPRIADQECGRLLRGVSIIVSEDMRIGLQEKPNIGVPDPLADHLGLMPAFSAPVA